MLNTLNKISTRHCKHVPVNNDKLQRLKNIINFFDTDFDLSHFVYVRKATALVSFALLGGIN